MSESRHGIPLDHWPREMVIACVRAYQHTAVNGGTALDGWNAAEKVYLEMGGTAEDPFREAKNILEAVQRDHPDWFWKPIREWLDKWNAYWKRLGIERPKAYSKWPGWPHPPEH